MRADGVTDVGHGDGVGDGAGDGDDELLEEADQLSEDADEERQGQRFRSASLLYAAAADAYRRGGERQNAFWAAVRSAIARAGAGDAWQSLTSILELLHRPPPDAHSEDVYEAKLWAAVILGDLKPDPVRQAQQIDEIEHLSAVINGDLQSDGNILRATLFGKQCRYDEALRQHELAWARFDPERCPLSILQAHANAVHAALRLGQRQVAARWAACTDPQAAEPEARFYRALNAARIALADNDAGAAMVAAQEYDELASAVEAPDGSSEEVGRAALLAQALGDPAADDHPARRTVIRHVRFKFRPEPNNMTSWWWRLFIVDYRLAAVRFAAGISPVDDLYYFRAHDLENRPGATVSPADYSLRLRRARQACRGAMRLARGYDALYDCHGYGRDVESRLARLDEMSEICPAARA